MDIRVVDDNSGDLGNGRQRNIVLKTPLSSTAFRTCWNDEARFQMVIRLLALICLLELLLIGFGGKENCLILVFVVSRS